jgi:hypothetical protein
MIATGRSGTRRHQHRQPVLADPQQRAGWGVDAGVNSAIALALKQACVDGRQTDRNVARALGLNDRHGRPLVLTSGAARSALCAVTSVSGGLGLLGPKW